MKRPTRRRLLIAAAPIVVLAGCSGGDSTSPPAVAAVRLSGALPSLAIGQQMQLSAAALDADGGTLTGRTVEWRTSDVAVATVGPAGLVTAVAVGNATITASAGGKSATAQVQVTPPPVATVRVLTPPPTIDRNATVELQIEIKDASGAVVGNRVVTWSTSNPSIATVTSTGATTARVTGVGAGTAQITATSEGQSGSVAVEVLGVSNVALVSTSPATLVEGATATVSGSGFNTLPSANTVIVDGVAATVTASTATSVTFVVPERGCRPAGTSQLRVSVAGDQSAPLAVQARPASFFSLAQGQYALLKGSSTFCLQFDQGAGSESYVVGVQSIDGSAGTLTPVSVRGLSGSAATASAAMLPEPMAARTNPFGDASAVLFAPRAERWQKHRVAEQAMRAGDMRIFSGRMPALRSSRARWNQRASASRSVAGAIPGNVQVGAQVQLKFPQRPNSCRDFTTISGVVRAVGAKSIWVEDVANPAGGFSASDYQALAARMDNHIFPTNVEHFGEPTDYDGNGRVIIVITKEINETDNLLGKVEPPDLLTPQECPASNDGEVYYGRAPDPNGNVNGSYSLATALEDAPLLIAHEFAHVIQIGRRLENPVADFPQIWELEGQATFAEEVNGHRADGRQPRQNYGRDIAFNTPATVPINWYLDGLSDLFLYFGFESRSSRIANAPEQCSWLARNDDAGSTGPCLSGRDVYGVPWSLLRWITDHFGPSFPGGDRALHRALVDNRFTGFATLSDVTGAPIDEILSLWAASLYVDDRYPGLNPRLTFPSWNLFDIEGGVVEPAHLLPRARAFGAFTDQIAVRGGSSAYYVMSGAGRPASSLQVRSNGATPGLPNHMRLWVVRVQ